MSISGGKFKSTSLRKLVSVIVKSKGLIDFTLDNSGFSILAHDQSQMRKARALFPGTVWKKEYSKRLNWWNYTSRYKEIPLKIWGVSEAPKTCKAIMETRVVTEQVPTVYKTVTHKKQVVVGWDCKKK